jgi:serine/threonine protein kinase/Flp pilus assembly protein TadD
MTDPNTVKSIFLAASEKPLAERSAFLDQAVGDDTILRARIEALLKAHDNPDSFLKEAAAEFGATIDLSPADAPLAEKPGTLIGPYKLLEQIGEGGMGVVYMADQQAPVRRRVALKIIKAGMDTRQVIARFEAERQALALMDHSNIARVLDAGATDSGRPYFVMELVKGVPITEYCDQHNLSIPKRLELFGQVCQAVQHAHQKGLIHRDIKPSNVLVSTQDDRPVAKVIDFGVAKAMQGQLTEKTLFTEFQHLVGTPAYMSPEQAGGSLDIDTRSDVYSLGVLLYELLAGTPPFDPKELRSKTLAEMQRIIREVEPPTPSTRLNALDDTLATVAAQRSVEPRKLAAMVHGELDWIVMKALEKDRTRRYETPGGMARDIERYLRDEPVLACPPSVTYRLKKFIRRNKIAAAFVLLLVAAVAALTVSNVQTRRNERRATTQTAKAKAVSDLLQKMLASSNPDEVKSAEYTVRQLLDDFSAGLSDDLAEQPEVEAEILATIGRAYWRLGVLDNAEPSLKRALEMRRRVFGSHHEKVAESLLDYAWYLFEKSRHSEAEPLVREALNIYQSGDRGAPEFRARWTLQRMLVSLRQFDEADAEAEKALALARKSNIQCAELANILHVRSAAQSEQGRYVEAERSARQAVEMHHRLHGPKHPETGWGLQTLGVALLMQKKYGEAEAALREAIAIFQERYSGDHKSIEIAAGNLNSVLQARGDKAAVAVLNREQLEKQIRIAESSAAEAWLKRCQAHIRLGQGEQAAHSLNEARQWSSASDVTDRDKMIALYEAIHHAAFEQEIYDLADASARDVINLQPDRIEAYSLLINSLIKQGKLEEAVAAVSIPPEVQAGHVASYDGLGWVLLSNGAVAAAEKLFRQALEHSKQLPGDNRVEVARGLNYVAFALRQQGKLAEAEAMFREALPSQRELLPADHEDVAFTLNGLGLVLAAKNKLAEAEAMLRESVAMRQRLDNGKIARPRGNLIDVLARQGKYDEAVAICREDVEFLPNDLKSKRMLGTLLANQEKLDEAIAVYRDVIRLEPSVACTHSYLAVALRQKGLVDEAISEHRQAIRLLPVHPDHFTEYATTLGQKGTSYDEIADMLRSVLKLQPDSGPIYASLASILSRQGKNEEADAAWRKAIELEPDNAESFNTYAWNLATAADPKRRDPPRAVELAKKAVELAPKDRDVWNTLGVAQYCVAQWQPALDSLQKSSELRGGGDASDWYFLAMANWQLGHKDEARTWYDKAVEWMDKNQPKNEELLRFRNEAAELLGISEPAKSTDAAARP